MGLAGVFIGTIISSLVVYLYSYPKYVYATILKREKKEYVYEQINYFFIFMITILILDVIISFIKIENIYLNLVTNVLVSMVVSITIFVILYHKTDSFRYYCNFVKSILKKIKKK